MGISKYNSQKIRIISFWSIIFVVYIHSPYLEAKKYIAPNIIQQLFTDFGFAIFAVPIFYFISGYLFFFGVTKYSDCYPKIKKRISTLLIPYILWNIIFLSWYISLAIIPGVSSFVNGDVLSNVNILDPIGSFLFLFIKPVGFHLWFLRDLILFVFFTPLLFILIKKNPVVLLLVSFLLFGWIPRFGLIFFVLGGVISVHSSIEKFSSFLHSPISHICLSVYILNAIITIILGINPGNVYWQYYIQIIQIISIGAIWGLYDMLFSKKWLHTSYKGSDLLSFSFFIYLFHEPTFNIIKKIGLKCLGESDYTLGFLFLVNPFIIIAISICIGYLFKKYMPKVYGICVGGR